MKKCFTLVLVMIMPILLFGQSYASLWKKVEAANEKDLPKTEYELLQKIVAKAEKGKDYGQLLMAELQSANVMAHIAPDSLEPAMERLCQRYEATTDVVLKTVYQTVLHRIYSQNSSLVMTVKAPELTPDLCERLAKVKDAAYNPFVIKGADADIFNHDLLHVVGYELDYLNGFREMHDYYKKVGNRRAACMTAVNVYRYASKEELDSVIHEYEDLPECGELALERYRDIGYDQKGEKLAYIQEAISKWGSSWPRLKSTLENNRQELTNPQFRLSFDKRVVMPEQSQKVTLTDIRNLRSVSLTVYKVNAKGNIDISPDYSDGYKKIKPLLGEVVYEETREYTGKTSYEFFEDALTIKGLPVGVYMLEFQSNPSTEIVRRLYFVTDVYTIAEDQPGTEGVRYVVVSSKTGQPIAGAHLHIKEYMTYAVYNEFDALTNNQGEYIFKTRDVSRKREVFTYTDTDNACPTLTENGSYSYYDRDDLVKKTCIYTDRAIYRPGQKVFVNAILYQVEHGMEQTVQSHVAVRFQLRDANAKVVSEQSGTTDDYGASSCEFTLPSSGLTGSFCIRVNGQNHYIRVEEYKRPTFHVEFPEVKQAYAAGDTLTVKGNAMTYAGVPVQGAKVSYKVVRRTAFWWWSYSRYWETATLGYRNDGDEIFQGEAETGTDGTFDVTMPLVMPETQYPMYYQFVVTADVTDTAGETHSGQLSLPLGNKKQTLSVEMEEKMLIDDKPVMTFHLMNAAGKKLDASVRYRIDDKPWQTATTNTSIPLTSDHSPLTSGKHTLEATCEGDSLKRDFVIFSLDDERPATETDDWFYQSDSQFSNDGKPVTIQVGSSDQDVHIVYSVFSGKTVIKRGAVDRSNQLLNLKLTYEESYGNGLLLTFAWVKNGKCYTHSAQIKRPLPDKRLTLAWTTFRDRLKPGQQEEWTLTVNDCDGKPVDAQLMATLYDQSLDMLQPHSWSLVPYLNLPMPSNKWFFPVRYKVSDIASHHWSSYDVKELDFSQFDHSVYPTRYYNHFRRYSRGAVLAKGMTRMADSEDGMVYEDAMVAMEPTMAYAKNNADAVEAEVEGSATDAAQPDAKSQEEQVQVRDNLNETAFFYPQLTTDAKGRVALKFTLPESLTTWRLLGLAHTRDMYVGSIIGEAVAQKDVMIQPNVPRFLRDGDMGAISARIFNTGEKNLTGKAQLRLLNPETNAVVYEQSQNVSLKAGETTAVTFTLSPLTSDLSLLICQMTVSGKGFSDGEQHYLPLLPSQERVTVTMPITQNQPGTATVDLTALVPADAKGSKLTFEYTNQPAWLMIQALPTVGTPSDDNAISQAASYYANSLGRYILKQNPQAKSAFDLWKQETGEETSLTSALAKNQELKDLLLNETPWVLDAENETEQKQRLADFFNVNLMQNRLNDAVTKLKKLQRADGSWSWWQDMPGSFYMTVAVSEMLVRLNEMAGEQRETVQMLSNAFGFMGKEIIEEVKEMKKWEKEGHEVSFPSFKALEWLYLTTLDGRTLPGDVVSANNYLLKLLKKEIKSQSIYEKALTAVILSKSDPKRAAEYAQSLKEWTVYREDIGRYYDTPRAGYSWYDYKIPTQTVAIEALQRLDASDKQTLDEMRRWLLQEKRTQAWDTPINSVNAVYAFLQGGSLTLTSDNAVAKVDGQTLDLPKATAAIGYVKTPIPATSQMLTVEKTSEGTSWGAVYAQFVQATHNIAASGSGITVKRELMTTVDGRLTPLTTHPSPLKVGDRVKMRITIKADRDYDFVQVVDKRAACLEPVRQLSGWHQGSYCTPKDYTTNYYFDCLSKGTHVIESEYYIDRAGCYETGTCTVECAYAPEFRGIAPSMTLNVAN